MNETSFVTIEHIAYMFNLVNDESNNDDIGEANVEDE